MLFPMLFFIKTLHFVTPLYFEVFSSLTIQQTKEMDENVC